MKTDGLQSVSWTGYFDEKKDSIMGRWRRCMICHKIPCDIRYHSDKLYQIYHCPTCNPDDFVPKTLWAKFWVYIDKKLEKM